MTFSKPDRRQMLTGMAALPALSVATVSLAPLPASATPQELREAVAAFTKGRPTEEGRVTLDIPPISENGNSVSLSVSVESPMTEDDHVRQIAIFAEANPLPDIVRFTLGPRAGRAEVATRIRLNDSQTLLAVAEMNDGTLWTGTAETVVTLAACGIIL
ncbi:MAG: SoxY-related AACIE arm protein [Pseudomonadota bacterium]